MGIDILCVLVLFIAFFKGFKQGIIMSVFSVASLLIGFFVTMHFSFLVSDYLVNNTNIGGRYLPIVAFTITFTTVAMLVRWLGKLIERGVNKLLPTTFNRLLGAGLWMALAVLLLSQAYQLMDNGNIFKDDLKTASVAVPYLEDIGGVLEDNIGDLIPFVKGLYKEADEYFKSLSEQVSAS